MENFVLGYQVFLSRKNMLSRNTTFNFYGGVWPSPQKNKSYATGHTRSFYVYERMDYEDINKSCVMQLRVLFHSPEARRRL